ncbi:neurotransmitter:Na+ symporter, NSS family [Anaerobranca californiensis DSM 14826]|jgi:NSS family neurotransmitter:Na+ symporter|uniref:Neurotransmitter:Na+ symporter, NSS family n=1 Tax=Anaerobranca californiensis DSM 14826 TaxID=1120989 RepID=A0A1M6PPW2_9FIRM|nr:sodium-dependent transporter [Anaerobranca californiensis]SHK09957.1 neurotransmitter:Na+ symporter, NSS family [Anaerobranca californiensis DSM 14826]
MAKEREQWGSKLGFILAAAGSAIGLGNIWRFPTVVGQSGGGIFILIYLIIIFLIGIPLMICELTIGRRGKSNIVRAFKGIKPGSPWWIIGALGVAAGFIILSFYSVIAGWSVAYIFKFLSGGLNNLGVRDSGEVFGSFVASPIEPLIWHGIFMAMTIGIVIFGIDKGIEKASKIMMPILFVLLLLLALRSITLPGAFEGLKWYLTPNLKAINIKIILGALGQVFFSLSLGMGAMMTYGSYLTDDNDIPNSAMLISLADLSIAVLAGFIIIPAVFAFDYEPNAGPSLIFITLPAVFAFLPLGNIFGGLFFSLLTIAALTSAISLLEVPVAYFIEEFKWSRKEASIILGSVIFILGIPSSLSMGILGQTLIFGKGFLDFMDFFSSNLILPIGGLLTALFVGWVWGDRGIFNELEKGRVTFTLKNIWFSIVKYLLPIVLFYILITGLI